MQQGIINPSSSFRSFIIFRDANIFLRNWGIRTLPAHLQKDMHARQITEYTKELSALYAIDTGTLYDNVQAGCFVETATVSFFVAAGIGKQLVDGKTILFLSASAPLALALKNKKTVDGFNFGGAMVTISALY